MTKYTINEIWSHFATLGMGMYGSCGKDDSMCVDPGSPRDKYHPLPNRGWVRSNAVYYYATPELFTEQALPDHIVDAVMTASRFDRNLYRTLHTCLGVSVEAALVMSLIHG